MAEETKKFGLDMMHVDADLELRLRKIERDLALKAQANNDSDETQIVTAENIAAITGLSLINGTEVIEVKWDAAPIGNLKHYEVQADDEEDFNDPTIVKTPQISKAFTSLNTATTYYIRVRAINTDGDAGTWSGTLNTTTAQVTTGDITNLSVTTVKIADESTTKISTSTVAGPISSTEDTWVECLSLTVTKDVGTDSNLVIWFGMDLEQAIAGSGNGEALIRLQRDNSDVIVLGDGSKGLHVKNDREVLCTYAVVETGLTAGDYQYDIDFDRLDTADFDAVDIYLIVLEIKK